MKKVSLAVLAVGVSAGALFVSAAPASAAIYECPTSHACVYDGDNYSGDENKYSGYNQVSNLGDLHDKVNSWINANNSQQMQLGDFVNNRLVVLSILPAGWVDNDLAYPNRADFVGHS